MSNSIKGRKVVSLILISALTQAAGLALQVFVAHQFGASANLDAYLAGLAIPQYLILIFNTGINASLIPAYYEQPEVLREAFLRNLVWTVTLCSIPIAVAGAVGAPWLFRAIFSDLAPESVTVGIDICRYGFLILITSILINMLTAVHYIRDKFEYQALIPAIAQVFNLGLVFLIAPLGIYALLVSFVAAQSLQVVLLLPVMKVSGAVPGPVRLFDAAVLRFFQIITPMTASTVFIKSTGLWDRFLAGVAANGSTGTISRVDYAAKITAAVAALSISSLPTLIYPTLAAAAARKDHEGFIKVLNDCLFFSFFVTAPIVAVGYFVTIPAVTVLLQRGRFTMVDTLQVAAVLQVYLLSLVLRGMGGVTGNALYALKLTGWVSVLGSIETLLYVGCAYWFTVHFGAVGIPVAVIVQFFFSIVSALLLIRHRTGGGRLPMAGHLADYLKTSAAAAAAAVASFAWTKVSGQGFADIFGAALLGGTIYLGICHAGKVDLARKTVERLLHLGRKSRLLRVR